MRNRRASAPITRLARKRTLTPGDGGRRSAPSTEAVWRSEPAGGGGTAARAGQTVRKHHRRRLRPDRARGAPRLRGEAGRNSRPAPRRLVLGSPAGCVPRAAAVRSAPIPMMNEPSAIPRACPRLSLSTPAGTLDIILPFTFSVLGEGSASVDGRAGGISIHAQQQNGIEGAPGARRPRRIRPECRCNQALWNTVA